LVEARREAGGCITAGQIHCRTPFADHEERAAIDGDRSRHDSSPAQIEADLLLNKKNPHEDI
jgi:hypothetical protein